MTLSVLFLGDKISIWNETGEIVINKDDSTQLIEMLSGIEQNNNIIIKTWGDA